MLRGSGRVAIGRVWCWGWRWNGGLFGRFFRFYPRHDEGPCGADQWSWTSSTLVAFCSKGMLARSVRNLVQPLRVRAWLALEEHTPPIFPKVENSRISYSLLLLEGGASWRFGWDVWRWRNEGLGALLIEGWTGHRGLLPQWLRLWWTDPTSMSALARCRCAYLNSCTFGLQGPRSSLVDVLNLLSTARLHQVAFS